MKVVVGIDLGSTTTKAVLLDEAGRTVGKGVTNSRSDYEVACAVARQEAHTAARFQLLSEALHAGAGEAAGPLEEALGEAFRLEQHLDRMAELQAQVASHAAEVPEGVARAAAEILEEAVAHAPAAFLRGHGRRSDFFRDMAAEHFMAGAEKAAEREGVSFEKLVGVFDRSILEVETRVPQDRFGDLLARALHRLAQDEALRPRLDAVAKDVVTEASRRAAETPIEELAFVGTGYGRQTLPFPKEAVRSEILCHGRGAHSLFPGTRTVLDIGGQDTKAIQVDETGVVTAFQMNDRCAAGCGRYLGYIADELNLGLHELGPLALQSKKLVRINSTCTVFAGAELRERIALGDKREDILGGLHNAIIVRAMSLLARSGGVKNELTFTGGVCRNQMATKILGDLVHQHYGPEITLNIHPGSIYMGALGAALFALDDVRAGKPRLLPTFALHADGAAPVVKAREAITIPAATVSTTPELPRRPGPARAGQLATAGIDVGSAAVKVCIVASEGGEDGATLLATSVQRIRRRSVADVAESAFAEAIARAGITRGELAYVATTGDGDPVREKTGHFYSMTAHARGARYFAPEAAGVLDVGALHTRAIRIGGEGRVLGSRMTSQCASGSGQFLENIARYLGVAVEDVGPLSMRASKAESVSGICAVLAETDVINMVARGIPAEEILRGIHRSIAGRIVRLVGSAAITGVVLVAGGLSRDEGLVAALDESLAEESRRKKGSVADVSFRAHPDGLFSGALGAALLAAYRFRQLESRGLVETQAAANA